MNMRLAARTERGQLPDFGPFALWGSGRIGKAGGDFMDLPDYRCLLCHSPGEPLLVAKGGAGTRYAHCRNCGLAWMDPGDRLSREEEHAHYNTHENSPADPRYRRFLNQLWEPLRKRLQPDACGLDYGSGPGPTLHLMAREDGFPCTHYDPFFAPEEDRLDCRYDFITCSETAEHFHDPRAEFAQLHGLLRPGGWLAVMTQRLASPDAFAGWFYRKDPTHTCFYQDATFRWIAREYGFAEPEFAGARVVLLKAHPAGRRESSGICGGRIRAGPRRCHLHP